MGAPCNKEPEELPATRLASPTDRFSSLGPGSEPPSQRPRGVEELSKDSRSDLLCFQQSRFSYTRRTAPPAPESVWGRPARTGRVIGLGALARSGRLRSAGGSLCQACNHGSASDRELLPGRPLAPGLPEGPPTCPGGPRGRRAQDGGGRGCRAGLPGWLGASPPLLLPPSLPPTHSPLLLLRPRPRCLNRVGTGE